MMSMESGWMDGRVKRRRDGGNDWAIIELGSPGIITEIDIDTSFLLEIFLLLLQLKVYTVIKNLAKTLTGLKYYLKTSLKEIPVINLRLIKNKS